MALASNLFQQDRVVACLPKIRARTLMAKAHSFAHRVEQNSIFLTRTLRLQLLHSGNQDNSAAVILDSEDCPKTPFHSELENLVERVFSYGVKTFDLATPYSYEFTFDPSCLGHDYASLLQVFRSVGKLGEFRKNEWHVHPDEDNLATIELGGVNNSFANIQFQGFLQAQDPRLPMVPRYPEKPLSNWKNQSMKVRISSSDARSLLSALIDFLAKMLPKFGQQKIEEGWSSKELSIFLNFLFAHISARSFSFIEGKDGFGISIPRKPFWLRSPKLSSRPDLEDSVPFIISHQGNNWEHKAECKQGEQFLEALRTRQFKVQTWDCGDEKFPLYATWI